MGSSTINKADADVHVRSAAGRVVESIHAVSKQSGEYDELLIMTFLMIYIWLLAAERK